MLQRAVAFIVGVPPVLIDGTLYVLIAVFGTVQTVFTTEEAYKYVSPHVLFWGKATVAILLAGVSAIKIFRSTAFARHVGENRKVQEEEKADAKEIKAEQREEDRSKRAEDRGQRSGELHGVDGGTAAKPVGD